MWTFNVEPVPEPRMVKSDKWKQRDCVMRYRVFCDEIRLKANTAGFVLGKQVEVIFLLPMPQSWSDKKKAEMKGKSHESKPDTDNLLKAFCDALKESDSDVWNMRATKFWWDEGKVIVVENKFMSGDVSDYLREEADNSRHLLTVNK